MSRPGRRGMPTGERARVIPGRDFENIDFHTSSSLGRFHMDGIILLPPVALLQVLQSANRYNIIRFYHQEDNPVLCTVRTRSYNGRITFRL